MYLVKKSKFCDVKCSQECAGRDVQALKGCIESEVGDVCLCNHVCQLCKVMASFIVTMCRTFVTLLHIWEVERLVIIGQPSNSQATSPIL
jgi:hypothetical protein